MVGFRRSGLTATCPTQLLAIIWILWVISWILMGQKARMEEGFFTAELGADAHGSYCRRVPMLMPFLPHT
jgi:protein-S-isoprenylcysteine O-methyltransferase Ste14